MAVGQRERGSTAITTGWLDKFLIATGITREEFDNIVARIPVQSLAPSREIPLYPNLASAGQRAFCPEDEGAEWTVTVDRGDSTDHPQAFAVKVNGDSMQPKIEHGDTIICEPIDDEEGWRKLTDGCIVAVWGCSVVGERDWVRKDNETRPEQPAVIVPDGGMLGQWVWLGGGAAQLRKLNDKYPSMNLPPRHDGKINVALVVQLRRNV